MTSAVEGLSLPMREDVVTAGDDPEKGAEERAEERKTDSSSCRKLWSELQDQHPKRRSRTMCERW
jgi:mannose/fructose-specific phosphotransferase system component IIA